MNSSNECGGLAFVQLSVRDWPRAVAWYREVLGLREVMRDEAGRFALLQAGAAVTKLALKEGEGPGEGVLLAFEVADLAGWERRLRQGGADIEGGVKENAVEAYRRLKLRDPEGYEVVLYERFGQAGKT